ncbi:hypothetical protein BDZ91DRAFT_100044 [Kalaharituber pfeilii]|nr:hypothetical protein BDZ91DRAFT_100044 [Kalaharituber pfeilii]
MDSARGNQPTYSGRGRRGSTGSGSVQRGEDGPAIGAGSGYQGNFRPGNDNHNDLLKTIYVSNITTSMPDDALWEAFGQFGRVESLVRRDVNVDMNNNTEQQYAFIRYRNRQDARYAISAGELNFYGRKLVIRPRDKPAYMKQNGHMNDRGARDCERYEKARTRSLQGPERRFDQRGMGIVDSTLHPASPGQIQSMPTPASVELLSKILTVSNLPADMSPKELYELFSGYGSVERSYIYQQADALGRRFGEVTMASFFFAQKAFEGLNCFCIRGFPLDVSYKVSSDPMGVTRNYAYAFAPQMQWPYQLYGSGPAIANGHNGGHYTQVNTGLVVPYALWNTTANAGNIQPNFGYAGVPLQAMPPTGHIPVCVYPHHTNGAQFHRTSPKSTANTPQLQRVARGSLNSEITLSTGSGSRSVSGASSATLVANNNETVLEMKYQSPVIVSSPTYSEALEKNVSCNHRPEENLSNEGIHSPDAQYSDSLEQELAVQPEYEANPTTPSSTCTIVAQAFDPTKPAFVPETTKPRDPSNLYIKNLDDQYITTTMDLKAAFGQFGQIASAYLATFSNGVSKGFGFVAFVNPADAVIAKEHLDGAILGRKRVFVTFAERREERTQRLRELFEQKKGELNDELKPKPVEQAPVSQVNTMEDARMMSCGAQTESYPVPAASDVYCSREVMESSGIPAESEVTVTTTVTTTKAWKGTQLQGIVEVEEEESPCTKKFRQQRTQAFVQQAQNSAIVGNNAPSMQNTNCQSSPSIANRSSAQQQPHQQPCNIGKGEQEFTGSPMPVQQRPRPQQPQRRSQSPRNGPRPFYPHGRGDSSSPKPATRPVNSPTTVPGAPTGPRAQINNNRMGSANNAAREAGQKKRRMPRRANDSPGWEPQIKQQGQEGSTDNGSSEGLDNRFVYDSGVDVDKAGKSLESLEIRSAP